MSSDRNYTEVKIEQLVPFKNHPFKLYEGQRFTDMVESIRANGVITPVIVRPTNDDKYEILSGHNRVEAAKEVGFEYVPAIIREDLTDDEALLIVTESNLIQRSFADLKHSERAIAFATHYEAMKKKSGYRSDLLEGIEDLTCAPVGRRLDTREELGAQYDLSKNTIARYLRVNKLHPVLKERLDNDEIGMRVAETLSYLRPKEQEMVDKVLANIGSRNITMARADTLRKESEKEGLSMTQIKQIIPQLATSERSTTKSLRLDRVLHFLYIHFPNKNLENNENKEFIDEIENVIIEALRQHFQIETIE